MPTPPANALYTTFQVGSYNATTDSFTTVLDLNDRVTYWLMANGLTLAQPEKIDVRSNNIRTPGEKVVRVQDKNRHITYTLWIKAATPQGVVTALRTLIQTIQTPPYVIRLALPGATQYSYADVVKISHDIPANTQEINASALTRVSLHFECAPYFRGDRQWLQNLANNPGFEQGSGPAVTVFSDNLTNTNAYSVQAGGALTADKAYYSDAVQADTPIRYYRLDEASGTVAAEAANGQNGTYTGGYTLGVTGALTGDTDAAITLNGTTGYVVMTVGAPMIAGNGAFSHEVWIKFAANPASAQIFFHAGANGSSNNSFQMYLASTGKVFAGFFGMPGISSTAALSTATWHHVVSTWDGTTQLLYIDGAVQTATASPGAANQGATFYQLGAQNNVGTMTNFWSGQLDEVATYASTLSAARITAHYTAATTTPAVATNAIVIPSAGRVSFGAPRWQAINGWRLRFRYVTSLTLYAYLHYTDANNYLRAEISQSQVVLNHCVGGVTTLVATTSLGSNLTPGVHYWLTLYQYPNSPTILTSAQANNNIDNPQLTVQVSYDAANAIGATLATNTFWCDSFFAILGAPQLQAVNAAAALGIPNVATASNIVGSFGPGGWWFSSTGTGGASGSWDVQCNYGATTYGGGPVTSSGAARVDAAPAGTLNASWLSGTATLLSQTAQPVATAGDVLGVKAWVASSGVGAGCVQSLWFSEYSSTGTLLRTGSAVASVTGPQGAFVALSGTYTTGANCAYVILTLNAMDATVGSANGSVSWDNVQIWDQTQTSMTMMPYCELRTALGPAQLLVSGLIGDVPAPALVAIGLFLSATGWAINRSFTLYLGRRSQVAANSMLVFAPNYSGNGGGIYSLALDTNSPCGFIAQNTNSGILGTHAHQSGNLLGTFEGLMRSQVLSAGSPTTITLAQDSLASPLGAYYSPTTTPYATTNTWTLADLGKIAPVFSSSGSQVQYATGNQIQIVLFSNYAGVTWTSYYALVPTDGEILVWNIINQSTIVGGIAWAYVYADGQNATNSLTGNAYAYPTPGNALVNGTTAGSINANMTGSTQVQVDPTQSANTVGVNQYVVAMQDSNGVPTPAAVDIIYSPRYLYPR